MSSNNFNNNRTRSSTTFSSSSNNTQGGFGAFLKSFMGNSVHDTTNSNPLLEGEDINNLEKSNVSSPSSSSSSSQLKRSLSNSSQMSNNSSQESLSIPIETLDQHLDHLFETYPETMRSYSEHQFMDMLSKFTQVKENQPLSTTTTTTTTSSNQKKELLALTETQKQNFFNRFILFKYGNVKQLENGGDYSRNSYIFKRMITPVTQIRKIALRWGIYIDFMSISYSNNTSKSYGTPTGGNDSTDIFLSDSEYIVKVSGYQREALMQIKFETNTGKIYGPYGNNTLTAAYPFMSSGACLKDLLVQEGKAGPTIFVKFHVVLGVCPEWTNLTPVFKTKLSECWTELSNIHERMECLAKKSAPPPPNYITSGGAGGAGDEMSTVDSDDSSSQTVSSSSSSSNIKSIGDFYEQDMIDFRRSIAKCYEILKDLNSKTDNHFDTFNDKLYKSFVNLFTTQVNPSNYPSNNSSNEN